MTKRTKQNERQEMMASLRTLIARADRQGDFAFPSAEALRGASRRVRITATETECVYGAVDGTVRYRTADDGCGLWKWGHGAGDGFDRDADGTITPCRSWHQVVGTAQLSGHRDVRAYVVDLVASDLSQTLDPPRW